jgi:hypothetical protein
VEPLAAVPHHLQVAAGVDEGPQRLQGLPDRQVDHDPLVLEGPDGGGVAVLGLEPPHEPGAGVGQGVDRLQGGHEPGQLGGVQRGPHGGHVDLGQVMGCHAVSPPWPRLYVNPDCL